MALPTPAEQSAYTHMQARLIALLLQHNQSGFRRFIDQRTDAPDADEPLMRPYRDLGVLFFLGTQLFEDILPRIVRRLSFASPRSLMIEEPPARGRIQWERTLDATWAMRPGEPPLQLHTRQRRRDFATPENLLTVATLLEYQASIQRVLHGDRALIGAQALRHPLNDLAARCSRELAFPQFAGIVSQVRRLLEDSDDEIATLEVQVAAHNAPGGNRAYQDLLAWRARWRTMQLLSPALDQPIRDVLGADPQRDNYLYQLWIFYELADLLQREERLLAIETMQGSMALRFTWGDDAQQCTYLLRHDQSVPNPVSRWTGQPNPKDVPGVRPDYYLSRIDPVPVEVRDGAALIWREPGIVWDAKYYRERESERTPSSPVKRMIADLNLLGEPYGVLLFAFLSGTPEQPNTLNLPITQQRLLPKQGQDQTLAPQEVLIRQLRPLLEPDQDNLQQQLRMLLTNAHVRLSQPRIPACHGIFLDPLSAKDGPALTDRWGVPIDSTADDLLLCPKPHIGPGRVDLVRRSQHCCKDARLCHIMGEAEARLPLRPPRTAEELLAELAQITEEDIADGDLGERASQIAQQIERLTRRLATEMGVFRRIEVYYHRVRDMGLGDLFDTMGAPERESLALAVFLVEQLDTLGTNDYSAPAIHLSSVVEIAIQRRVFSCPDLVGDLTNHKKQTLGVLPFLRQNPAAGDGNWPRILKYVGAHWNEQIDPDDTSLRIPFDDVITRGINRIAQIRNMAAHTSPVKRPDYTELQKLVFQGGKLPRGVLSTLIRAWKN